MNSRSLLPPPPRPGLLRAGVWGSGCLGFQTARRPFTEDGGTSRQTAATQPGLPETQGHCELELSNPKYTSVCGTLVPPSSEQRSPMRSDALSCRLPSDRAHPHSRARRSPSRRCYQDFSADHQVALVFPSPWGFSRNRDTVVGP